MIQYDRESKQDLCCESMKMKVNKQDDFQPKIYAEKQQKEIGSDYNIRKDYLTTIKLCEDLECGREKLYEITRTRICCPSSGSFSLIQTAPCPIYMKATHCGHVKEHTFWERLREVQTKLVPDPAITTSLDENLGQLLFHLGSFPGGMQDKAFIAFLNDFDMINSDMILNLERFVVVIRVLKKRKSYRVVMRESNTLPPAMSFEELLTFYKIKV